MSTEFYRCCGRYWCGQPRCRTCGLVGLVIADDDGPTEEGREILNSLVRDAAIRDALARQHEERRPRKYQGRHVDVTCRKCGRTKPGYLPGRVRTRGMLAAMHPQDLPRPDGGEICTCNSRYRNLDNLRGTE